MTHGLADQHFRSYEEVKNWIDSLKLLVAVFQDMLRVIQNFLYFSGSVPENGLWWLDKRLVVSLCLLLFF